MLARHQVQCVVIGCYAAVLAGIDIVTRDVDITPATDEANLERLAGALDELNAAVRAGAGKPPVPPTRASSPAPRSSTSVPDAGDLDITSRPDGTAGISTAT